MKKEFIAVNDNGGKVYSILIKNWDGKYFRDGRRYGDVVIAEYEIILDGQIPKLVKNEEFKPYRCLGWGGDQFEDHKGIDWEANKVREKLNLNREPTEEEMNKYFTKEYIKECKAEKIQIIRKKIRYEEGLSYQQFYKGDYRYYEDAPQKDNIVLVTKDELWQVNVHYWLPTGDQLDNEIVRIITRNTSILLYSFNFPTDEEEFVAEVYYPDEVKFVPSQYSTNPLIAKIKLLKELLK